MYVLVWHVARQVFNQLTISLRNSLNYAALAMWVFVKLLNDSEAYQASAVST